jgi:hypothetical protein
MSSKVGANVNKTVNSKIESLKELKLRAEATPENMTMDIN